MDTTRADSVSAYGVVASTTPAFDALAATGVRYARAYANAPWTLPSHATLFTGLLPHQHGVGWQRTTASDDLVTLAERLQAAGYQTVGFTENAWVGESFNLNQGFEHFELVGPGKSRTDFETALARWLPRRDASRPLFLFVNVVDAHAPYEVRDANAFLPEGVTVERAAALPQGIAHYMCRATQFGDELEILRGLYLGDVAAADAKLAYTRDALNDALRRAQLEKGAELEGRLITIATSDHGEHFGEHEFVQHAAGLGEALIHVPLVLHAPGELAPAVIDAPVQLAAISSTVLQLAGLELPGEPFAPPLPTSAADTARAVPVVAEWTDPLTTHADDEQDFARVMRIASQKDRQSCEPRHRAFGDMRTLIRHPYQVVTYDRFEPALFDLRDDPVTRREVEGADRTLKRSLVDALDATRSETVVETFEHTPQKPLPADVEEQLRALGYLGRDEQGTDEPPSARVEPSR